MRNYDPALLAMFSVNNGYAPAIDEGPRSIPIALDFSLDNVWDVDFSKIQSEGKIGQIQAIYVDNSANAAAVLMVVKQTGQRVNFPAGGCYTWPVFSQNPFQAVFTSVSVSTVRLQLLNVPLAPQAMGPITVNATIAAVTGVYTDASGAFTGASQVLFAANALRKGLLIANPSSNISSMWINFGAAATLGQPSIEIPVGSRYDPPGGISTQQVTAIGTAAETFTAKELA